MKNVQEFSTEIGGKTITAKFTDLADQADGSVMLESENTVVFATAVMGDDADKNPGFFNLTVDYMEKHYAAGEILGSRFQKREGRPTDEATLSSRIIDRTIRPLFDQRNKNSIQIIVSVLSVGDADPSILGINAASIALHTSNIPWGGPIGAVHTSRHKDSEGNESDIQIDHYLPDKEDGEQGNYTMDYTICGKDGKIVMIEAMGFETPEEKIEAAFNTALPEIEKLENWQRELREKVGQEKKKLTFPGIPEELVSLFQEHGKQPLRETLSRGCTKQDIYELDDAFQEKVKELYPTDGDLDSETKAKNEEIQSHAHGYYHEQVDRVMHELALTEEKRADGRSLDEVRSLFAQAGGVSPLLHGSGIFYRGGTHILSVLTLGSPDDAQIEEGMEVQKHKRFMHHYNFPPFSAGETGRVGGTKRREIGHGTLVERALTPVLPNKVDFPYTIRLVSESMASNGSTSQASVCASSLALMDGGVPVSNGVAGIAMGAIIDETDETIYKILTDIQGPEDHHGDMDFKVAGTKDGVTAIQLDIKVGGIPPNLLIEALGQAKEARLQILETMDGEIATPREEISNHAPKIFVHTIEPEQIGTVIGKGGETIQDLQEETGATVTIEDDGTVYITGKNSSAEQALESIKAMTKEWKVGESTTGTVARIMEGTGVIVNLNPWTTGMVHISEIAPFHIDKIEQVLSEGQKIPVKVISVDKDRGRIGLSIKQEDENFIKQTN